MTAISRTIQMKCDLARTYADDGELHTAADILDGVATEVRLLARAADGFIAAMADNDGVVDPTRTIRRLSTINKHTPGPWFDAGYLGFGRLIVAAPPAGAVPPPIAVVYGPSTTPESLANAKLIAASPQLYEAARLHQTYEAMPADRGGKNGPKGSAREAWLAAEACALAKAEG